MRSMLVWKRILGTVLTTTCLVLPGNEVYGHKEPVQHKKGQSTPVLAPRKEPVITTMTVTATGYTAGYESTGKRYQVIRVTVLRIPVLKCVVTKTNCPRLRYDPKTFPLGSILYIPGYGYGIVADTGSAIKGNKIDLYFKTTRQVYSEWGKKEVDVQIIRKGSGKCTEKMLNSLQRVIETHKSIPAATLDDSI